MMTVYTDGSTDSNGLSGIGIVIKKEKNIFEYNFLIEEINTNHEAEFAAVKKALEICKDIDQNEILSFRTDAKVVVDAIDKRYTGNDAFAPILKDILALIDTFPLFFIKWIPTNENKHADELAKRAIR
ncbi:MAG TPA: ribonuclease HI family protein [Bacillota bacterium]|nr:ribonuclease HI family protein [Bacillota bacterium]